MQRNYDPGGQAMYVDIGNIMDYGRYCLGLRDPEALSGFVEVIQIVDATWLPELRERARREG